MTAIYREGKEDTVEELMREFYLSSSYDPKAKRPADNVKAAIGFALAQVRPQSTVTEEMIEAGRTALLAVINGTQSPDEAVAEIYEAMHKVSKVSPLVQGHK